MQNPFFELGRGFFSSKMPIFAAKCLRIVFGTLYDWSIFLVLTLGSDRPMLPGYLLHGKSHYLCKELARGKEVASGLDPG